MRKKLILLFSILFILSTTLFVGNIFSFSAFAAEKTAYETILEGILSYSENINIAKYRLSIDEMTALMEDVLKNEPRVFYADESYGYMLSYISNTPSAILPAYEADPDVIDQWLDEYDASIDAILDTIPEKLDDYQKVIYLHDYICVNYQYDLTYEIYDAYTMMKEGTGVCMAYALLLDELLSRLGIESRAVVSPGDSLNHMWNEVLVDGKWYEIDATWDDPVADRYGKVSHSNLLLSDAEMYVTHNGVYDLDYPCTSTEFDDIYWSYLDSPFGFVDGQSYVLDYNEIYAMDIYTGESEKILTVGERYSYDDNGKYIGCVVGFGSYGDWLYYNDRTSIRRYSPISKVDEVYYTPDASKGKISGMYLSGNVIHYLAATDGSVSNGIDYTYVITDDEPVTPHECVGEGDWLSDKDNHWKLCSCGEKVELDSHDEGYWVTALEPQIGSEGISERHCTTCDHLLEIVDIPALEDESYIAGDVNNDKNVDSVDYLIIKRSCFGSYVLSLEEGLRANVDGDDDIDSIDYVMVKRIAFGSYVVALK